MIPDRAKVSVVIVAALLAALIVAPVAAEEIIVNDVGTLAGDEDCNLTVNTTPLSYDEPKAEAAEGAVTITASGTGVYYLGEEITLSGTNTASATTYLFLTGPNLATNGVKLVDPGVSMVNGSADTFTSVAVEADDTWIYRWDTSSLPRTLDAGGYTVYAVSEARSKDALSGVQYATTAVQLKSAFITATSSGATVAKGDELTISGRATGDPDNVYIWIFGKNYYKFAQSATVESDSTFEYKLESGDTRDLSSGEYLVVIQHPMNNGPGVTENNGVISAQGITPVNLRSLQASDAVSALINALDSPYVDDTYTKFPFRIIEECWIQIDPINDPTYGETFAVTGTTDYPAGTALAYEISKNSGDFYLSGETIVTDAGDWRIDLDTATIGPGAFTLWVTAPNYQAWVWAAFDVYDEATHPVPPAGATYRVERISMIPSFDDLAPGEEATLYGTINAPWGGNQGSLEFSTDLKNPVWSCSISRDGVAIYTKSRSAKSLTLTPFELDYGQKKIQIYFILEGTVPEADTEDPTLLRILERDADGRTIPDSEHRLAFTPAGNNPTPPSSPDNLTLSPGWNFISIPRPLAAGNDTAMIFAGIDTDGRAIFRYNTTIRDWTALEEEDRLVPLEGFWIYSAGPATVPLNFSTDPLLPPAERTLSAGWNAIGTTGTAPATARDTLYSVNARWSTLIGFNAGSQSFESGVVNGGSGANADTRSVYPGRGYWLHMTGPGTLCAIGA